MKKINVFIHTLEDIDYFYKNIYDKTKKYIIYSTHAGVMEYCLEKYKFQAILISSFFYEDEIQQIVASSEQQVCQMLLELDNKYSKNLSKHFNCVQIDFFSWLYSYHLPFILEGFLVFERVLEKLGKNKQNIVFNYCDHFYNIFYLKSYIDFTFIHKKNYEITWYETNKRVVKRNILSLMKKALLKPQKVMSRIFEFVIEFIRYNSKNKTIIYMENLYDLNFVKFTSFRCIPYAYNALSHKFNRKNTDIAVPQINHIVKKNKLYKNKTSFIQEIIKKSFLLSWNDYYIGLKNLEVLFNKEKIDIALWGNPPVKGFKAIFYAYLKARGIPVVGMQHGASYVDQNIPYHYYSDFMRCTNYISYGFTQEDFELNFKAFDIRYKKIHPLGTTKLNKNKINKKCEQVDVLFPVSNTISIFDGGFSRTKPDVIHSDQMKILDFLEQESKFNITAIVKPIKNTDIWQTSVFLKLKKLHYTKVEWNMSFLEKLNETCPKCVVLEFISTPLYEVLNYDVDIFLFVRDSDNLTEKAREMLNKRVYIVVDFKEFQNVFLKWVNNKLPQKRDKSYYNYYVHKENAKDNIVKLMENL